MQPPHEAPTVVRSGPAQIDPVWRPLFLLVWAVWWGGLTFYAAVVVPLGTDEFGSMEQGFLTQRVSLWLNLACGVMIAGLICWTLATRRRSLGLLTGGLAVVTALLVYQHLRMTRMMDVELRGVTPGFYAEHAVYLWLTTAQWILGAGVPWLLSRDRARGVSILDVDRNEAIFRGDVR